VPLYQENVSRLAGKEIQVSRRERFSRRRQLGWENAAAVVSANPTAGQNFCGAAFFSDGVRPAGGGLLSRLSGFQRSVRYLINQYVAQRN
jgi:hypothetical protein